MVNSTNGVRELQLPELTDNVPRDSVLGGVI